MKGNNYPPVPSGTIITTTRENPELINEWTPEAKAKRRWGVRGEVIGHSDSHGLCYAVKHSDGEKAWYDPSEFQLCMLAVLHQVEKALPNLLRDESIWKSVRVDYHPPIVDRVWTQFDNCRINLHKIYPCEQGQALFHPHPWPSAMRILSGRYSMLAGYGKGEFAPPVATKLILNAPDEYEMTDPDSWHSVTPLDNPSYSLLVTGPPWDRWAPKSDKHLEGLGAAAFGDMLMYFRSQYC